MAEQRVVAGVSCDEVLALLSEFVDGDLDLDVRQRILDHIAGCNWCEEFGGRFSSLVTLLRSQSEAAALDEATSSRLERYLSERMDQ